MAGLYFHIPFCSQKCNYCDFYSIVPLHRKPEFVSALAKELENRANELDGEIIDTIYFGGGTPSLLSINELKLIKDAIVHNYKLNSDLEFTFEANPENITQSYLVELLKLNINRLSIGIQSFRNEDLEFLKRTHSAQDAIRSVKLASQSGFSNISMDLIYGLPNLDILAWSENLKQAFDLPIQHLSAYHLSYESGTLLHKKLKNGAFKPLAESKSTEQFELLLKMVDNAQFEMYEISNFALAKAYSNHNMSYWKQKKYLGFGPSAHSFNLKERSWNVSNLVEYNQGVLNGKSIRQIEKLSVVDRANEMIMTNLRTKWGIDLFTFETNFGINALNRLLLNAEPFIQTKWMVKATNQLHLTQEGYLVSDFIIERLFAVD